MTRLHLFAKQACSTGWAGPSSERHLVIGFKSDGVEQLRPASRTMPWSRTQKLEHMGRHFCRIFMFPVPGRVPAGRNQPLVGVSVAGTVGRDFGGPVAAVRSWGSSVERAAVPVAAVDEDSDLASGEHDVGPSTQVWKGLGVHPVPAAGCVQQASDGKFRGRIPTAVALHGATRCFAGCPGLPAHWARSTEEHVEPSTHSLSSVLATRSSISRAGVRHASLPALVRGRTSESSHSGRLA